MGIYLNPGNKKFEKAVKSEIYVDKTMLLSITNSKINTLEQNICISRPRRFGKSMAANMLAAYYGRGCDSKALFKGLKIAEADSFEVHLNQYDVVFLNMQEFLSRTQNMQEMLAFLKKSVLWDLLDAYPDYRYFDTNDMIRTMQDVKEWYDGYSFPYAESIYSPRSVVMAVLSGICDSYWNKTETFEALRTYIDMNFEGLKDDVLSMIAGERIPVRTGSFVNDMTSFEVEDDVLTLLIHLGYLAYDIDNRQVYIPNNEIREEFINCVSVSDWGEVSKALKNSAETLQAVWQKRPGQVSQGIEQAHFETSHIQYHDENALSYTISLALFAARNFYTVYRELPTGKGFADMVYLPRRKFPDKPALVVELKWNHSAQGAIDQIKKKQYVQSLENYKGNILLVGINYDKATKEHDCVIEEWEK